MTHAALSSNKLSKLQRYAAIDRIAEIVALVFANGNILNGIAATARATLH
jgi:hypothetical protein